MQLPVFDASATPAGLLTPLGLPTHATA
jgi:hypothetical protein